MGGTIERVFEGAPQRHKSMKGPSSFKSCKKKPETNSGYEKKKCEPSRKTLKERGRVQLLKGVQHSSQYENVQDKAKEKRGKKKKFRLKQGKRGVYAMEKASPEERAVPWGRERPLGEDSTKRGFKT